MVDVQDYRVAKMEMVISNCVHCTSTSPEHLAQSIVTNWYCRPHSNGDWDTERANRLIVACIRTWKATDVLVEVPLMLDIQSRLYDHHANHSAADDQLGMGTKMDDHG